jgi:broad specificity phosphatase PhoE
MTARSIFLVRHAPTASNVAKLFMGQQDVPAMDLEAPERFRIPRQRPRRLFTSPLSRARTSVGVLFPGEKAVIDARLAERSVGEWEGLDHATVRARWPDAFVDGVISPDVVPPGGESLGQLRARVASFLADLEDATDDVYVVTHNGWIRTALLLNGDIGIEGLFAEPVPFLQPLLFVPTAGLHS